MTRWKKRQVIVLLVLTKLGKLENYIMIWTMKL